MLSLPDRGSRACADRFEVFDYRTYEDDGWAIPEWRMRAFGVSRGPSEWLWPVREAPDPVIGRIRIKTLLDPDAYLGNLAELASTEHGLTEILNLELEPAFLGQGHGRTLLRAALEDVPDEDIVACEPKASTYKDVPSETSVAAVDAFYRQLGFVDDRRAPGYLIARRADLHL